MRRLSSSTMTSAATLRPAKLSGPASGAFQVEMNVLAAVAAIATVTNTVQATGAIRLVI